MGSLFSPKVPQVPTPPPLQPQTGQGAAAAQKQKTAAAGGVASTIATSPSGLTKPATTAKATLLGG